MLETKEIVQSRVKATIALFGSSAFVAIAVLLPRQAGESNDWRWWCGAFFGLGVLLFSWLLIRPQRLTLDKEGFAVSGGLARWPKKIPWRSIEPFFLYQLPRGGKVIAFIFQAGADVHRTLLMKLNAKLGADGSLPRLWPGSPDDLVDELNAYRQGAIENLDGAHPSRS